MANDESDWLQRFLQSGIYQTDGSQPHSPANNPSRSSVNRELSLGLPSPYQMLMTMTNNNPSQYFQRHTENGTATVPPGTFYVDPRDINPPLIRARLADPGTYQVVPQGNAASQSVHRLPHSSQSSPTPVGQRSDNPPHSGPQTATQQVPTSSVSQQRPQMTTPIESRALQNHSQPSRASPALIEKQKNNSAHSASYPKPPVSASQQPRHQEPAFTPSQATHKPFQPFKTSNVRASPVSGVQHKGNSAQPGAQSTRPTSTSQRPPVPPRTSSPAVQQLSQPSRTAPTPANQQPGSSTHPGQQSAAPLPRHQMPPSASSPAVSRPLQPSGSSPSPANQGAGNSTHPSQTSASSLPTLQRRPIPQSASSPIPNASLIKRPPYHTPPKQQDPNDRDHVTKKRRLEDGSSETKARPELQSQKTTGPQHPKMPAPTNLSSFTYSSSDGNSLKFRTDIVQAFNKLDALEKPVYDPATIARDILITSGRHPTERPLNSHLFPLKDIFVSMAVSSDLDTIRWDMVEAETRDQARAASMALSQPSSLPPQQPPIEPASHPKPPSLVGRPSWPASSQTQQSLVNTAQPTPSAPQNQQFNFPLAPPGNKRKQASPPSAPTAQQLPERQSSTFPKSNPKSVSIGNTPKKSPVVNPRNPTGTPKQSPVINIPNKTPPVDLTKRGPAGSPARRAPPADQPEQTPGAKSTKQAPIVSIPKRTPPQAAVAVSIPKREQSVQSKSRNKQSEAPKMVGKKQPMVEVSIPVKDPVSYPVFTCKWKDCHASLHNLSILKKHVIKIHIPHHLTCQWDGCKHAETMAAAKLNEHIMSKHVEPIAWELGDGPSDPATGERASDDCVLAN